MLQDATAGGAAARVVGSMTEQGLLLNMLAVCCRSAEGRRRLTAYSQAPPSSLGQVRTCSIRWRPTAIMLAEVGSVSAGARRRGRDRGAVQGKGRNDGRHAAHDPRFGAVLRGDSGLRLVGSGASGEAEAALKPVLATGEPRSLLWKVEESNSEIRIRTFLCLKDADGLAQEIVKTMAAAHVAPAAVCSCSRLLTTRGGHGRVASVRARPPNDRGTHADRPPAAAGTRARAERLGRLTPGPFRFRNRPCAPICWA
jgi:hypothetical protein